MERTEYSKEWIKKVRNGMKQGEFCKHIYVFKKNGTVCQNIHRNTLGNWESGRVSLPRDIETFLSLVLWEYDHTSDEEHGEDHVGIGNLASNNDLRNKRYQHARTRLNDMLHVDLYCRNLHDALLIQVTRGILSFEDVPKLEDIIEKKLAGVSLSTEEKNDYAIERNTVSISSGMSRITNVDELIELITVTHKNSFASANRIIGSRFKQIYESRDRYPKHVSLERAIVNLAPNYRNSYVRMFTSSFISRDWLLDLCEHLQFSRDEINHMLEAAHMVQLSDKELGGEIYEDPKLCTGVDHNSKFLCVDLKNKLEIMVILGCCFKDLEEVPEYVSARAVLESFSIYEYGDSLVDTFHKMIFDDKRGDMADDDIELDGVWRLFREENVYKRWSAYIELGDVLTSVDQELIEYSKKHYLQYENVGGKRLNNVVNKDSLQLIHFIVAMYYSILFGKIYEGKLVDKDLIDLKKEFNTSDGIQNYIYIFLTTMLGIFLGEGEIYENADEGFYTINAVTGKKTKALDLNEILEDIFEAIISLEE